jgi:crotonobetainyl-CoA:carnitine CoA-transferase CaiB-like acyl-CoA transferase
VHDAAGAGQPDDPEQAWAHSGAMALTGSRSGPGVFPNIGTAAAMHGAAGVLAMLSAAVGAPTWLDGPALLGERAALAGLTRNGAVSCGGTCRLLPASDGWLAVNLARAQDAGLLAAWLEDRHITTAWDRLAAAISGHRARELEDRAALLGLPVGRLPEGTGGEGAGRPFSLVLGGPTRLGCRRPLVVDLSAMWAGPLCAHLLGLAGARVVKVESWVRPDGARGGSPAFFDLLHGGHASVAFPFDTARGIGALRHLIDRADIVVESSRPRALEQLGIDAAEHVARGAIWVSITAYGRDVQGRDRVGFGDDVGVAAGAVAGTPTRPWFCSDAIADPVAGLHAAVAALGCWAGGAGALVDVSMRSSLAATLPCTSRLPRPGRAHKVRPPHARAASGRAARMGEDTAAVLADLGIRW